MSWLKLDDGFDTHPKLLELTELQRWRWARVLLHCARHRTEGHVKPSVLRELGLGRAINDLLRVGLLEENGDTGYLVHDWSAFNPKDPTKAERQARWREKQASTEPSTKTRRVDVHVDGDVDASVDVAVDDPSVYSRADARARPVPSRPKEPLILPSALQNQRQEGKPEQPPAHTPEELERLAADLLHEMPA